MNNCAHLSRAWNNWAEVLNSCAMHTVTCRIAGHEQFRVMRCRRNNNCALMHVMSSHRA